MKIRLLLIVTAVSYEQHIEFPLNLSESDDAFRLLFQSVETDPKAPFTKQKRFHVVLYPFFSEMHLCLV